MNLEETNRALALVQAFDRRTVGEMDVRAWHSILGDLDGSDVMAAIRDHYAVSDVFLMPVHIRRAVAGMVAQRERAARSTPWAAGQYGVLKADAMPEVAGPVDEKALTPEVRDLLASVRAMLPEGSRETLMPRTVAWEREHAAYRRAQDAEPNPHYRPGPSGTPCFDRKAHGQHPWAIAGDTFSCPGVTADEGVVVIRAGDTSATCPACHRVFDPRMHWEISVEFGILSCSHAQLDD